MAIITSWSNRRYKRLALVAERSALDSPTQNITMPPSVVGTVSWVGETVPVTTNGTSPWNLNFAWDSSTPAGGSVIIDFHAVLTFTLTTNAAVPVAGGVISLIADGEPIPATIIDVRDGPIGPGSRVMVITARFFLQAPNTGAYGPDINITVAGLNSYVTALSLTPATLKSIVHFI